MSKYIVEIADEEGHSFKVACSLDTLARVSGGSWRTLDKGGIRPNNGRLAVVGAQGTLTTDHLLFLEIQSDLYGIRLNDFRDFWGVNAGGTGYLAQPWALGIKPTRVTWALVE